MENLDTLFTSLSSTASEVIAGTLDQIGMDLVSNPDSMEAKCQHICTKGIVDELHLLLNHPQDPIRKSASMLAAEIAKFPWARQLSGNLVPIFSNLLASPSRDVQMQACRAAANICYENSPAKDRFLRCGGIQNLIQLIRYCASNFNYPDTELLLITCGCLLNMIDLHEASRKAALTGNVMEVLCQMLPFGNDAVSQQVLTIFLCYAETPDGRAAMKTPSVPAQLTALILPGGELQEPLIQLIMLLCNEPDFKVAFYEQGIFQVLLEFVANSAVQNLYHAGARLMAQILTDFRCSTNLLSAENIKETVDVVLDWFAMDDLELKTSATLIFANVMCSRQNCERFLKEVLCSLQESTFLKQVIDDLRHVNESPGLIAALLGVLKNLVICQEYREKLVVNGLSDAIIELTTHLTAESNAEIVERCAVILRLIVGDDEDSAEKVGTNEPVVQLLVASAAIQGNLKVSKEVLRLVSWAVKFSSYSELVMANLAACHIFDCLVELMKSQEKEVRTNVFLTACVIASATEFVVEQTPNIRSAGIVAALQNYFRDTAITAGKEERVAALAFVEALCYTDDLRFDMLVAGLPETVEQFGGTADKIVGQAAAVLLDVFQEEN